MPRVISNYALARRRAYYLRYHYARRNRAGYRGQAYYKKQWPFVYRAMFKNKHIRRRYRYSARKRVARMRRLYPHYW